MSISSVRAVAALYTGWRCAQPEHEVVEGPGERRRGVHRQLRILKPIKINKALNLPDHLWTSPAVRDKIIETPSPWGLRH